MSFATSNGAGKARSRVRDFQFFDKLPPDVRELLRNSNDDMDSENLLAIGRRYGFDPAELLEYAEERVWQLRAEIVRDYYGHTHPMAPQECRWPLNPQPRRKAIDTRMKRL